MRGISGQGTFIRNNIHHTEDGIYLTGSNTLIQDNYIHDLQSNWSGPHYDGIATDGGVSNITIRHNTIINPHGQTSALMLSNYFGSVTNVTVDNNWLEGGGYTVYSDGQFNGGTISGVSFTNNYLVRGQYGYSSIRNNTPVWQGNVDGDTGLPVGGGSGTPALGAPTIGAFSTDSGIIGDGVTSDNTLTLTGSAVANSTVKVFDGAIQIGTVTANGSGAWSFATAALVDGNHNFTATASSGSTTSPASAARSVRVDTMAPGAPTIASFSSDTGTVGDGITSDNTLTLAGAAAANSSVKVYDGGTLLGTVSANSSGAWSYATATLINGSHNFTATAIDAAGNTSVASSVKAVIVDRVAPMKPAISSFSTDTGTQGDGITTDHTLTLTGTAAANSTVKMYDGVTLIGTTTAGGNGAWGYTTATLADGSHSFTATATDAAGNVSAASTELAVTVIAETRAFLQPSFELAAFTPGAGGWSSDDLYKRELADVNGDGMADIVGFGQCRGGGLTGHRQRALCSAHV